MRLAFVSVPVGKQLEEKWVLLDREIKEDEEYITEWGSPLIPPGVQYAPFEHPDFDSSFGGFGEDDLTFDQWRQSTGWKFEGQWLPSPTSPEMWRSLWGAVDKSAVERAEYDSVFGPLVQQFGGLQVYFSEFEGEIGKKKTFAEVDGITGKTLWGSYVYDRGCALRDAEALFWKRHKAAIAESLIAAIPSNPLVQEYRDWLDCRRRESEAESAREHAAQRDRNWNEAHSDRLVARFGLSDRAVYCSGGEVKYFSTTVGSISDELAVVEDAIAALIEANAKKAKAKAQQRSQIEQERRSRNEAEVRRLEPLKVAAERAGFTVLLDLDARNPEDALCVKGVFSFGKMKIENPDLSFFCEKKNIKSNKPLLKKR